MQYLMDGVDLESIGELVEKNKVNNVESPFHQKFSKAGNMSLGGKVFVKPVLSFGDESKTTLAKYKVKGASLEIQKKGYLPVHFEQKAELSPGTHYLINDGTKIFVSRYSSATSGTLIGYTSDIKSLAFLIQGAGGSGGGTSLHEFDGGGGGAGGTLLCVALVPKGVWTIAVGAGGIPSERELCGIAGEQSYININGTTYAAYGGAGGVGPEWSLGADGSGGGTSGNGIINITGQSEGGTFTARQLKISSDFTYSLTLPTFIGGIGEYGKEGGGGASPFGRGGNGGTQKEDSNNGDPGGVGAGGGGGDKSVLGSAGGDGGDGVIFIYY